MEYKTVQVRPWKVGDIVVSKITEFRITKGREYKITKEGSFLNCFFIIDDSGLSDEYTDEYFEIKINKIKYK